MSPDDTCHQRFRVNSRAECMAALNQTADNKRTEGNHIISLAFILLTRRGNCVISTTTYAWVSGRTPPASATQEFREVPGACLNVARTYPRPLVPPDLKLMAHISSQLTSLTLIYSSESYCRVILYPLVIAVNCASVGKTFLSRNKIVVIEQAATWLLS